jgi:hypothetical protein
MEVALNDAIRKQGGGGRRPSLVSLLGGYTEDGPFVARRKSVDAGATAARAGPAPVPLWRRLLYVWSVPRNGAALLRIGGAAGNGGTARAGALDGLRALAALWIVAVHCIIFQPVLISNLAQLESYTEVFFNYATRFVFNGTFGVDIFFVLSGYLIMAILRREMRGTQHFAGDLHAGQLMCACMNLGSGMGTGPPDGLFDGSGIPGNPTASVVCHAT